jgi:hypothetical protein
VNGAAGSAIVLGRIKLSLGGVVIAKKVACLGLALLWSVELFALPPDLNMNPEERQPIRNQISSCQTMLVPKDQGSNQAVAIPFSTSNDPKVFATQLREAIDTFGAERLRGGTFYVLGVTMNEEASTKHLYEELLAQAGLSEASIKVMSVPNGLLEKKSKNLAAKALEQVRYFFPSRTRDYETPQIAEVTGGWTSTALTEVPNVLFLYSALPFLDANLTVTSHTLVLAAYTIYTKSMLNWLLRSGSKNAKVNAVEIFMKQMLLSLPFVVNYNVFGQFSKILAFYAANGWAATVAAFPMEAGSFVSTQGLSLALQTLFYSTVITNGFGGWVASQPGVDNSRIARAVRPLLQTPLLMADSVLLAMAASGTGGALLELGPFGVNSGQVGLALMTTAGYLVFKKFPNVLAPTLQLYSAGEKRFARARTWLFEPSSDFKQPFWRTAEAD